MKWIKPSGVEVETNDRPETVKYASSLGWKPVDLISTDQNTTDNAPEITIDKPRRKRRTKAEMEAARAVDNG
jgi:hypothetical protein